VECELRNELIFKIQANEKSLISALDFFIDVFAYLESEGFNIHYGTSSEERYSKFESSLGVKFTVPVELKDDIISKFSENYGWVSLAREFLDGKVEFDAKISSLRIVSEELSFIVML
jgi:hypothetical protein